MKLISNALAHKTDLSGLSIVKDAIIKYQLHIVQEILHLGIDIVIQILLYSRQVHWLLNDVKVVKDVQLDGVDRLLENPGITMLPKILDQSLGCFIPAVINWGLLRNIRNWKIITDIRIIGVFKIFYQLRVFLFESFPLLIVKRLVRSIFKNSQLISIGNFSLILFWLRRLWGWSFRFTSLILLIGIYKRLSSSFY